VALRLGKGFTDFAEAQALCAKVTKTLVGHEQTVVKLLHKPLLTSNGAPKLQSFIRAPSFLTHLCHEKPRIRFLALVQNQTP